MIAFESSYGIARRLALPALMLCLLLVAATEASAQSRVCRQIEAELAALSKGGKSAQYRKYDRAVKTQQNQLRKAERAARRAGCKTGGGISIFGRSGSNAECRSLVTTIRRMQQNLTQLERRRARYEGGGSLARRARLMTRLAINGCREDEQVVRRKEREKTRRKSSREVNILDQIFDNRSKRRAPLEDNNGNRVRTTLGGGRASPLEDDTPAESFRTLCVRTCDGYYFPVSFSASQNDLDRDQKVCQAMCPGTDVQLYYHKVPEEESEDMVSISGEPYTELATAFLYRQTGYKREKSCGCSPQKDFSVIAGSREAYEQTPAEPFIPLPVERPDPAADPETLANRDGGLTPDVIARILTPPPEADDENPVDRKVRVVGPVFLPDPEGAIDLQAQGQPNVQ